MKLGTYRLLLGRPSGRHGWWPRLLAGAMLVTRSLNNARSS